MEKAIKVIQAVLVMVFLASCTAYADVDWISWSNGWVASKLVTGDYVSAIPKSGADTVYAAKIDGGIDWLTWSGNWGASPLYTGRNYRDISATITNSLGTMYGVNTSGGVDWIAWNSGWNASSLVSGNYVSVADKSAGDDSCFAARADGGIDWINWYNGGWQAVSLGLTTSYIDIAPDANKSGFMWGVTSSGGIDYIDWSGGWRSTSIVSGNYLSVCAKSGGSGAYASRADGGIDWIILENGWVTQTILATNTVYSDISMDQRNNGFFYGTTAVPEPGALTSLAIGLTGLLGLVRRKR